MAPNHQVFSLGRTVLEFKNRLLQQLAYTGFHSYCRAEI